MIENKNTKDIFIRNAIAGTLDYLNRNVYIDQIVEGVETKHAVKFYYNFGQDEQFMKDFFVQLDHGCVLHKNAEGNFEKRPCGVLKFNSFAIRASDMTNKYVRATFTNESYTDNMEKRLAAYSAYLMRLPMTIKMSVDIQCDNLGQSMRIMESILTTIYKSNVVYFQYMGMRVPGEILMSDSVDLEKKTEFTYDDNQKSHAKFEIDFNTTFPVFDESSIAFKANQIREFRLSLETKPNPVANATYIQGLLCDRFPSGIVTDENS